MRANNICQSTVIKTNTPQSQTQRKNYTNSRQYQESINTSRPTLSKLFSIDFNSDLLETVAQNVPDTKKTQNCPIVKLEDDSSLYSKGCQQKNAIHSAMGDIKTEEFLTSQAVPVRTPVPLENKVLKNVVEEFSGSHSKTVRTEEYVTSMNETREKSMNTSQNNIGVMVVFGKGQTEKKSVATKPQQQKKKQVTNIKISSQENTTPKSKGSFGRESETAAKYRMFRSWLCHNKAGAPPREVLPDVVGSSLNSVVNKTLIEKRPLGQLRASNANSSYQPSYRAPILSYSIHNFGSHRKTIDTDDEFSRIPAERLYSALVGSSLHGNSLQ